MTEVGVCSVGRSVTGSCILPLLAPLTLALSIGDAGYDPAHAQALCPTPASVNGTACTVTAGTTIVVNSAAVPGLTAVNPGGQITADNVTIQLGPGALPRNFVGASAQGGGAFSLN